MKTLKIFTLLAGMILCGLTANAQDENFMVVDNSFKQIQGCITIPVRYDDNNVAMAKVVIKPKNISEQDRVKLHFTGNLATYFEVEQNIGETWVYLTADAATFIKIQHPDFGTTEFWFPETLKPRQCYEMVLQYVPQKEEAELIVSGNMDNSLVYIDGRLSGIKEAKKMSEVGATHTWKIECEGYQAESGSVTLDGKTEIYKVLKPVIKEESLVGTNNKTKKRNRFFLGINAGVGGGFYSYWYDIYDYGEDGVFSIPFNAGVDFAFRLTDSFYLGAYGSIGMLPWGEGYDYGNRISPSFGLLTMFNQKNENAIIIGAGTCFPGFGSTLGMNFRLGYKFKNNLYLFGEVATCSYSSSWVGYESESDPYYDPYYDSYEYYVDTSSTSFFLHFGYRIF